MDVFNGLEDVRQYFQGLPAATGTTASPNYQHQSNNTPEQNHERSSSNVPYWPPQHELQARPPTRENTPQRPPSHHSESSTRPPSHHNYQHAEVKSRNIQNNYNYVNHESSAQPTFPFSVPHSRETSSNTTPAQQYQSHILPNPSYHQSQQQSSQPAQQVQQRNSSRSDLTSPQSYHQLQPPQSQAQQQSSQNYSYQNRSYYPTVAKSATPVNSYKTVATQPYTYDVYKSYAPPQPAMQNSNNSYTQKSPSHSVLEAKEQNLQNHNNHQQHKTTHNLPPIAALSNYHTGRSREAVRAPVTKLKPVVSTSTTTSTTISHSTMKQYGMPQQQQQQQQPQQQQQQPQPHQLPSRVPTNPIDNLQNYRSVSQYSMPTYNTSSYYSVPSTSSNNNYTPSYQSSVTHQNARSGVSKPHDVNVVNQYQHSTNNSALSNSASVDSVLDLSLKTIKTPADSTLDDTEENQRNGKYYQVRQIPPQHNATALRYSEPYTNQSQRNSQISRQPIQQPSAGAPKVDFLPNFNMPMSQNYKPERRHIVSNNQNSFEKGYPHHQPQQQLQQTHQQPQQPQRQSQTQHPTASAQHFNPSAAHSNLYMPNNSKKPMEGLPRIDFPPSTQIQKSSGVYQNIHDTQRKRPAQQLPPAVVQNKRPKMDDRWKQVIDKQIEQKFSSYQSAKPSAIPPSKELVVNGNFISSNDKNTYQPNQYQMQAHHQFANANNQYHQMNPSYVPSVTAHHYPPHITHGQQQVHPQQHVLYQTNLQRSGSHSSLNNGRSQQGNGGADKRVISILRSNLEMKGAKEAQKKMEQTHIKGYDFNQRPREVQHPSTDVTAPLQPKHSLISRQNVSPFTAATSLVERSTPPTYKFPKAVDSVRFEADIKEEKPDHSSLINQADLDGVAANLAARIRTKGELKQVTQTQHVANYIRRNSSSPGLTETSSLNGAPNASPSKDKAAYPPRRRLFSRNEEDEQRVNVPPRDKTGLRSSSETSVFDFPDSGDESEVPVSERQSLEDMRRDRKSISKQSLVNESDFKEEKITRVESPFDDIFNQACDNFLEQLMKGGGKKRGRRKKMEPDVLAKLETVTKEKPLNNEVVNDITIKTEVDAPKETTEEDEKLHLSIPKTEEESDSDVPLSQCKKETVFEPLRLDIKEEIEIKELSGKIDSMSESSSDSETECAKSSEEKRKTKLNEQIRKTKELTAIRDLSSTKPPKKPAFGDGSDFHPGWEEELYKYKKSLRMPRNLIQVTRPPNYHRLSTSLPDLDPCPSPTPSSVTDTSEFCKFKSKTKSENFDSDMDSNSSFNFSMTKNYDSEEGSSSVKSLNVSNKIMDRLLERYGGKKRKRLKKKDELVPKVIPKSENTLELLPTPSLEIKEEKKKSEAVIKSDSVFFGFRKKTVESFKDTFINNSKSLVGVGEQFTTVVLKSRTRTETRVLKQKATIREVFGEDRPASAPPVTCVDELKDQKPEETTRDIDDASPNKDPAVQTTKEVLKNKLLNRGKKVRADTKVDSKKAGSDCEEKEDEKDIKQEPDRKSETPSIDGEENASSKKRNKFRNIRRKGSSGFDYIRKKKKQVKKENSEVDAASKTKRRSALPKANLESVQDIQREIKMWVLNKGIGETHLHRSARLGHTDITAYCLEKMQCSPSPKDNAGYTPLHEACSRGHLEIAKLLLMYGANASESAQGGIRPLHEAAENGFVEMVRLLLSYGADPNLATYSGSTPLSLAAEECTVSLLKNHINDIQGLPSEAWCFYGPASCFDPDDSGYDPLDSPPLADPPLEDVDVDFEVSEVLLPNLYTLSGEPQTDRWVLLQDLSNLLKIKSKDALLRQVNPPSPNTSSSSNKSILRELKMADFLEQARCCQFLNASEKINTRSSKIALVKYTDKVRQLLNIEKVLITAR